MNTATAETGKDRVPFHKLGEFYGVAQATVFTWLSRDQFPASIIQDSVIMNDNDNYTNYADAWVPLGEALHWGRSHGRLNRDGTPNVAARTSAAKRFAKRDSDATSR
jgi:hypothetical protein